VVRAELCEVGDEKRPAAWALVNASCDGEVLCTGMADRQGRLALLFAYPEPKTKHLHDPSPLPLIIESEWHISLEVFYRQRDAAMKEPPARPNLRDVIEQMQASLPHRGRLLKSMSPLTELPIQHLQFGRELILKSTGSSRLFVEPA
jgi:hypothetical protein